MEEPSRNKVVVPARQATQAGGTPPPPALPLFNGHRAVNCPQDCVIEPLSNPELPVTAVGTLSCYYSTVCRVTLKVHKNENFFGFDFEFCTISLLVMSKY